MVSVICQFGLQVNSCGEDLHIEELVSKLTKKLSNCPFCQREPGWIKLTSTPYSSRKFVGFLDLNSGPLSKRIFFGLP